MPAKTRLDPLDQDLLARLEGLDLRLYQIVHDCQKYRHIIRADIRLLRQGGDPGGVRAGLERWEPVLREVKRLVREF